MAEEQKSYIISTSPICLLIAHYMFFINPQRACAARVTVLSLCVVHECVCYLANSYAINVQGRSKIQIECKCAAKGF